MQADGHGRVRVQVFGGLFRGEFVESIDVLGHEAGPGSPSQPLSDGPVGRVREAGGYKLLPPGVPLPAESRIPREGLRGSQILGPVRPPEPPGASESGDAGFCANSCTRKDQDPGCRLDCPLSMASGLPVDEYLPFGHAVINQTVQLLK